MDNKRVWVCDWCCTIERYTIPNYYYKAVYGDRYDPNDYVLGKIEEECVCNKCWNERHIPHPAHISIELNLLDKKNAQFI